VAGDGNTEVRQFNFYPRRHACGVTDFLPGNQI
jgi:hypothetical protein